MIVSGIWKSFVCLVRSAFSGFILHFPWYGQFVLSGSRSYLGQMCCRSLWNFMLLLKISIMLCFLQILHCTEQGLQLPSSCHDIQMLRIYFCSRGRSSLGKRLSDGLYYKFIQHLPAEIRTQSQEHAGISLAERRLSVLFFISGNIPLWKKAVGINLDYINA